MINTQFKNSELGYTCLSDDIFEKITGIKYESKVSKDDIKRSKLDKPQSLPDKELPIDLFDSLFDNNRDLSDKFTDYANDFLQEHNVLEKIEIYLKQSVLIHRLLNSDVYKELGSKALPNKWTHLNLTTGKIQYTDDDLLSSESIVIFDEETFVEGPGMPTNMPVLGQALYISNGDPYLSIWLHQSFDKITEYKPVTCPVGPGHILVCHSGAFDYCRISDRFNWKDHIHHKKKPTLMMCTQGMMKLFAGLSKKDVWAWSDFENRKAAKIRELGSTGSLVACYEFITKKKVIEGLKKIRNIFKSATDFHEFWTDEYDTKKVSLPIGFENYNRYDLIIDYSLGDLKLTSELFTGIWEKWYEQCNTPVILAGQLIVANAGLPTITFRDQWLKKCEEVFNKQKDEIAKILMDAMEDLHEAWKIGTYQPPLNGALSKLDWRVKKPFNWRKKTLPEDWPIRTRWWDDLQNDIKLTGLEVQNMLQLEFRHIFKNNSSWHKVDYKRGEGWFYYVYEKKYKIPHFKNPGANVGNIIGSDSLRFVEDDDGNLLENPRLRSKLVDQDTLVKILRYLDSMTTYKGFKNRVIDTKVINNWSAPDLAPCHTITGRTTSSLFSTLPARFKYPKIMSETKSTHVAPDGYRFVGFDFDSQEASFAAILADMFKEFPDNVANLTGLSQIGKITLTGTKENKDDIHWLVAKEVGIKRAIAKNANYAAIYGAMLKTLTRTIANGLPDELKSQAEPFARKYLETFKGHKETRISHKQVKLWEGYFEEIEEEFEIYRNGIASNLYNEMHNQIMKNQGKPENIFFGTKWPKSLQPFYSHKSPNEPSLCNYIIQAGCSTYGMLSAILCAIQYKIKQHNIHAIYCICIHDELWYLCKEEDIEKLKFIMFQAHMEVWCLLHIKAGLHDMPLSRAFPSGIAVDQVLRKSVKTDPSSPTYTNRWPNGKEYTVWDLNNIL